LDIWDVRVTGALELALAYREPGRNLPAAEPDAHGDTSPHAGQGMIARNPLIPAWQMYHSSSGQIGVLHTVLLSG
jgi:hypothetical protein